MFFICRPLHQERNDTSLHYYDISHIIHEHHRIRTIYERIRCQTKHFIPLFVYGPFLFQLLVLFICNNEIGEPNFIFFRDINFYLYIYDFKDLCGDPKGN